MTGDDVLALRGSGDKVVI
jgi:hypothetical protein